jgi:protein CpxP
MNQKKSSNYLSFTLILALGISVLFTYSAVAEPGQRDGSEFKHMSRDFGPHRLFRLLHKLDVSKEQRTAIGEVMDEHRPVMREFMFDMMDGKEALHAILTSSDYDPNQIEALALAQAKNAEQMFLATAKTFAEISAILTPDQRQQLAEMIEERRDGRREKRREHRERRDS